MIDNVRIVAQTKKEFVMAVRLFLERSDRAGLTLNEEALPYRTDDDEKLANIGKANVRDDFEFLGVCYKNNTIKNTKRLVVKLDLARNLLKQPSITRRQVAHIIGLCVFMAHTIGESMVNHFDLMRAYAKLFEGTPQWDEKFVLNELLTTNIEELIAILLINKERPIPVPLRPSLNMEDYDAVVVFDACKNAWAAKIHLVKEGKTLRLMKRFAKEVKFSAHAEPTAAKEVLQWVKDNYPHFKRVALVTDHKALAMGQVRWWTGFGGHSTAYHINEAFKHINGFAEVFFVDGEANICDEDSRSSEARCAKTILCVPCDESWEGLRIYEHPYVNERQTFKYF